MSDGLGAHFVQDHRITAPFGFIQPVELDHVASFLNYKSVERGLAGTTCDQYREVLQRLHEFLGLQPFAIPTEAEVRRFLEHRRAAGAGPKTIARDISCFREFFKHLQRDGFIQKNPMLHIPSPKLGKTLPRSVSETEVMKLIDGPESARKSEFQMALSLRARAICETLYAGGLRVSELTALRLSDLNGRMLRLFGKGSKERDVPLGATALRAVGAYVEQGRPKLGIGAASPFLFIGNGRRGRMTRQAVSRILRDRAKLSGIAHVSPHMLRHGTATHMLNHGADLRTIQTLLGHADVSTTEIYTHVSREHVRAVLERCHPRYSPKRNQIPLFSPEKQPQGWGICHQCKNPALPGQGLCAKHQERANESSRRSRSLRLVKA